MSPTIPLLPATVRYCEALRRFGLEPVACLTGAGARYNRRLWELAHRPEVRHGPE